MKWAGTSLVVQWLGIHLAMQRTDMGSIPGQGTKIPYALEQLNPPAAMLSLHTLELVCHNWRVHALQ